MFFLKCTQAAQKRLGLRPENLVQAQPNPSSLGNFYVHYFALERRKAVVFMSEHTLLSFLLLEGKIKLNPENLPLMLMHGLEQLLRFRGYAAADIDQLLNNFQTGLFSATKDRSAVANLNTIVGDYLHLINWHGGLAHCDLTAIIMQVNKSPRSKLDYASPWAVTASRVALEKSANSSKLQP